jgi:hypothetical protein
MNSRSYRHGTPIDSHLGFNGRVEKCESLPNDHVLLGRFCSPWSDPCHIGYQPSSALYHRYPDDPSPGLTFRPLRSPFPFQLDLYSLYPSRLGQA